MVRTPSELCNERDLATRGQRSNLSHKISERECRIPGVEQNLLVNCCHCCPCGFRTGQLSVYQRAGSAIRCSV